MIPPFSLFYLFLCLFIHQPSVVRSQFMIASSCLVGWITTNQQPGNGIIIVSRLATLSSSLLWVCEWWLALADIMPILILLTTPSFFLLVRLLAVLFSSSRHQFFQLPTLIPFAHQVQFKTIITIIVSTFWIYISTQAISSHLYLSLLL